jgi:hypothetical protein
MRLIGIIAVAAVSALLLASCSGSDYPKEPWMAYGQECEQLGFARGTPEHDKCRIELAREATPQGASRATTD